MTDCVCKTPPFDYRDYYEQELGIDETNCRYAEVSVLTCKACGSLWLRYLVEFEAFTSSGRWYRGLITQAMISTITPETAISVLESMPWYFYGGSFFNSYGQRGSGHVIADLMG